MNEFNPPVVLSFAHHDPTGNAGLQADIESAASLGCHCVSAPSALFTKDTGKLVDYTPVESSHVISQARAILEDMSVAAIKIGFPGSIENTEAIHSILQDYPEIPVVLEPMISVSGHTIGDGLKILEAVVSLLVPQADIITLEPELVRQMAREGDSLAACSRQIIEKGAPLILICGANQSREAFESHLYGQKGLLRRYTWERINVLSQGGSATLSASTACYIAHGLLPEEAIHQAQNFTRSAITHSRRLGMGQMTPNRFFWTKTKPGV